MRYLGKCTKEGQIKFISHLDFLRTMQRLIRRAELPAQYSKGFNPHLSLSIAQPLGVGVFSSGEYFDFNLEEELDEEYIKEKLSLAAPSGIKILDIIKVKEVEGKKISPSMALIEQAEYKIAIPYKNTENAENQLEELLNKKEWNTIKKTKKGEKEVNIRPLIKKIQYKVNKEFLELSVLVSCGSKENLSPQVLAEYIQKNTKDADLNRFVIIERKEMFTYKNNKLVTLQKYFKNI